MVQRTGVGTVAGAMDWSDGLRLEAPGEACSATRVWWCPGCWPTGSDSPRRLAAILASRGFQFLRDRGRLLTDVVATMIAGRRARRM